MALILSSGNALLRTKNSVSSFVKISFVTAAIEYWSRRRWQSASISAVLPEPTGLNVVVVSRHVGFAFCRSIGLPSNAHGECALGPVAVGVFGLLAFLIEAGMIELFVGVAVFVRVV